ncbi:kinase-like protein [Coemansia reversa NRRL 1564]|uniref:Kinase-like protein n=1 Tax=Coemansia reversa (strain ATCC 12441 / NRRL 1564) TaxID=763665 RepID=A0A2G5B7W2_COERN|nr:kinase-like protein [Coemansia reversa NRRL 1564]|eukprot:PIA15072.1 kinase-like protein [Coemansia reversa NRRL 1564]
MSSPQEIYEMLTATTSFTIPKEVSNIIGYGSTGIVGTINDCEVLKMYKIKYQHSLDGINREILIYKILGSHDNIVGFIEATEHGIKLERMNNGDIKSYIKSNEVDVADRVKWCKQMCIGMAHIHGKGVFHCDINASNMLIDENLNLKIGDFAGSCTENTYRQSIEGSRHFLPKGNFESTVKSEIFALGSTMYEIMQGVEPYNDLDDEEVKKRYKSQEFPDTSNIPYMGKIINGCWLQKYNSIKEVVQAIYLMEAEVGDKAA